MIRVAVQTADFSYADEMYALQQACPEAGAIANFVGLVRGQVGQARLSQMLIEHYPGMTEKALHAIVEKAQARWPLLGVTLIHRIGILPAQAQIVLVMTASAHRQAAFEACAFMMDYLKTDAPFWKKEIGEFGEHWVEARASDDLAKQQWNQPQ